MCDLTDIAMRNVTFSNWARTFSCTPTMYFAPKTLDQIKAILAIARQENRKIRVVGRGHSPSDIAFTDGFMISLQNYNKLVSVNEEKMQVVVQAGMTLKDLNENYLPEYNLALPVLGSVSDLTVGGAIATATHGSGIHYGIFSTYIVHMKILKPDGVIITCSSENNAELFKAVQCNLGCFGILLEVTIQCEKAFNLIEYQFGSDLQEVIEHLDVHLHASDHFRFLWFPHTENVVITHCSRTDKEITKLSTFRQFWNWFLDYGIGYYCLEFCYFVSIYIPALVPTINRAFFFLVFGRSRHRVDVSYKVFNFECLFKQYVTEWAIDRFKTGEVIWALKEYIESHPETFVHFPIEVRFIRNDDIYLSPAFGRDTCFINTVMYRPYGYHIPYKEFFSAFESIMEDAGGRPHWAKAHKITADKFQQMYPHFDRWCHLRAEIDPINMLLNSYMMRIFRKKPVS